MIQLNRTNELPKEQTYLHKQQEIFRYYRSTEQEIILELFPDNVLMIAICKDGVIDYAFDTGENIANHFNAFEISKSELIRYADKHINWYLDKINEVVATNASRTKFY